MTALTFRDVRLLRFRGFEVSLKGNVGFKTNGFFCDG